MSFNNYICPHNGLSYPVPMKMLRYAVMHKMPAQHVVYECQHPKISCCNCFLIMYTTCDLLDSNSNGCPSRSVRLRTGPSISSATTSCSSWSRRSGFTCHANFFHPTRQSSSRSEVYAPSRFAESIHATSTSIRWPRQHSPAHCTKSKISGHFRSSNGIAHNASMH